MCGARGAVCARKGNPAMRIVFGPVPASRLMDPRQRGWTPLTHSSATRLSTWAAVMAVAAVFCANATLAMAGPDLWLRLRADPALLGGFIVALVALVPVHELTHAVAYGRRLRDPELIMGLWPSKGLCYVLYDAPVRRGRVIWMCAAPFLVLSVLPLVVLACVPPVDGPIRALVLFGVVLHTACCMTDFLVIGRVLRQVPRNAFVHNQGWQTYWSRDWTPEHRATAGRG